MFESTLTKNILTKTVNNDNYTTTFTTTTHEVTKRILIKTIRLSTYFGEDPGKFYETYSSQGKIDIKLDISISNNSHPIKQVEYLYESDNAILGSREPVFSDVVLVYITVVVPVKFGTFETARGFYHMDFNPTQGHKHTAAVDKFEQYIPCYVSENNIKKIEADNKELLAMPMNIYLRPTKIRDKSNNSKIIGGTERTTAIHHTNQDFWFDSQDLRYDPTMLRLGKVVVHANSSIQNNMTILDTRTRGGGLDESLSKQIIRDVNSENLFNWDIGYFDGEAYQENGIIIIKLPTTLRDKYGENYQALVQEAVAKHKAYGVLPIIEYYDPSEVNTGRFSLLPKHTFANSEHISYFDPKLSTHEQIKNTEEGYLIDIPTSKQYVFKIPSYRLDGINKIRIKPHVKRHSSSQSLVGKVVIHYQHDSKGYSKKETYLNTPYIWDINWTELDFIVNLYEDLSESSMREMKILYVDIILIGPMMMDYISIKAHNDYDISNMEIIDM